jgi:hypothetical protein
VEQFSVITWIVSVAAVLMSGFAAWIEGNWRRRDGLGIGFAEHGGMWGDLLLLPIVNAVIVPHLMVGVWMAVPLVVAALTSTWLHATWHGGHTSAIRDHTWPSRPYGRWNSDLSIAGWLHVFYVAGEFGLILTWALSPMPVAAVILVALVLSVHVPVGLLQPGWFASGRRPVSAIPLLASSLALLWATVLIKSI